MNSHHARPAEMAPNALPHAEVAAGTLSEAAAGTLPKAAALSEAGASAVRGSPEWRQLSFRASGLTIELEITGTGDDRRLMGQLIPRQPAVVDIRHADGVITVEADAFGRFSAAAVPLGQVSLRCRLGQVNDHSPVITGWITV